VRFRTFTDFTKYSQKADFLPTYGYYYSGPPGEERITKVRNWGFTEFYLGPKGHEQVWKEVAPGGDTRFFATDEEPRASRHRALPEHWSQHARGRVLRQTTADGRKTWYFKGPRGFESIDYQVTEVLNADVPHGYFERAHYTGKRGQERVYKVERVSHGNGRLYDTHYLRGARGNEKVYKRVAGDHGNWVAYYETGEEHAQALRRVEFLEHLTDPKDGVRNPYRVDPGEVPASEVLLKRFTKYFEGPRGDERAVRTAVIITRADGTVNYQGGSEITEEERARHPTLFKMWRLRHSAWAPVDFLDDN
jgi:hypothetical protein